MDDDSVLLDVKGGVAVVSLNRPDDHNVVDAAADALFFRYLDLLRSDRDVRVVVWRGNGPSFSIGRDLEELTGDDEVDEFGYAGATGWSHGRRDGAGLRGFDMLDRSHRGTRMLCDYPVPIICALKGWSLGSSFERALLCDIRVAADDAKIGLAGTDQGVIPDAAGVAKLFEIGGSGLALDLALTGRRVSAHDALRLGLVSYVVSADDLDDAVDDLAHGIAERPPLVTRLVREHVAALAMPGVRGTLGRELVSQTMVLSSHDFHEHHVAREEGREPRYERR